MTAPEHRPRLVVLAGPTAIGKTECALRIARLHDGELIGADSVQVYRGFDIGSAKPNRKELDGVPHHLIDVVDPETPIDAMGFARRADEAIADIAARGRLPIVVGGTGLWIRALVRGLVDVPLPDPAIRERLEEQAESMGAPALHERLSKIDPLAAGAIHPNDALRIVRALEVFEQTGRPLGELRREHALGAARYPNLFVVLERDPADLTRRIEQRIDAMLAAGWVDEVRRLRARHGTEARAFGSVGYRQVSAHLEGTLSAEALPAAIRKATRTYARRQRTWFQSEPGVHLTATPESLGSETFAATLEDFLRDGTLPTSTDA